MRAMIMTAIILTIAAAASLANPLEEPFIQEISVSPPWIEVMCWNPDFLVGQTITTREGAAVILDVEPNDDYLVVLDSSNTTGFYLHPDGDSIIFSFPYEPFCSCIGYGTYGESAGAPPPGMSIESCLYLVYDGDEFPKKPNPLGEFESYIFRIYQ